ncbi:MAG: hypothetical protein C0183_03995 [Roseiflexus castenholzii]|uniref:hypothetical protein n=1 Tax=Roseiflexus castenholzii TaxID=120962 RepID=UPI000CB2CCBA|nr:MAG: hypothetical protein C0183_03995 [Roseiflexus castenholzii]
MTGSITIVRHADCVASELAAALTANRLIYGSGDTYASLITPSSCVIDSATTTALAGDLMLLWQFYHIWNNLYRASLAGEAPRWIARLCEYGLRPEEIQAQHITLAAGLTPRFCRVDYVAIGPQRVIAEVQWKSGGLGLFSGIHDVHAAIVPATAGRPGNLAGSFREMIRQCSGDDPVAVNPVRSVWYRGEHYLRRTCDRQGMRYIVFDRREGAQRIIERGGSFAAVEKGGLLRIDFLYAQELLPVIAPTMIVRLAQAAANDRLWIETPLNYVYRQKWGMALPFIPDYAHWFDDRLRALFGAVALLHNDRIDLSALADSVPEDIGQQLRAVQTGNDLADLSTAARRLLVLKCGSGSGAYYSQGRGVLRLNGSRSAARKTLAFVKERLAQGEPWIVQRYVDATYPVDVCLPWETHTLHPIDAHARFMVYATFDEHGTPMIIGGLGNFSREWKVSGKSAHLDEQGRITGAAFNEMRFGQGL